MVEATPAPMGHKEVVVARSTVYAALRTTMGFRLGVRIVSGMSLSYLFPLALFSILYCTFYHSFFFKKCFVFLTIHSAFKSSSVHF
jgi:hypothetical protein